MSFALDVTIKATLILACGAFAAVILRRRSAATRHAVWIASIAGTLILPFAAAFVPRLEWPVLTQATTTVNFWILDLAAEPAPGVSPVTNASQPGLIEQFRLPGANIRFLYLWAAGFALVLLRFVGGVLGVRKAARARLPFADDEFERLTLELAEQAEIRRPVHVICTRLHVSPMTWGIRRHTILLPASAREWSLERRRMVLAHELAHVKRKDGLVHFLLHLACSIYWFHPLVWYAARRVRLERERACDDQVLRLGIAAADYADNLIEIVRGLQTRRALSFAAAVSMAQQSQLETRLISILDSGARRHTVSKLAAAGLYSVAAIMTLSLAAIGIRAAVPLPPVLAAAVQPAPPEPGPSPQPAPGPPAPQRTRIGNGDVLPNNAVVAPQVIESSMPEYTNEAVLANIEGTVTLEASVDVEGAVKVLRVVKGLGYGLDQNAINAVMTWRFGPAKRNGAPVASVTQVDVDFRIPPWYREPAKDEIEPVKIGPGVTPPTVVSRVEPKYPKEARDARTQGTVVLKATIHTDGTVTVNNVVKELAPLLDREAIEALEQWKFKPGMRDGKAVPVSINIEINFNLR